MKIKLTFDQIDEVVLRELKIMLKYYLEPTSDPNETLENRLHTIYAFLAVIKIWTTYIEYQKILTKATKKIAKLCEYYNRKEMNE